jgi:hypothetical protein
MAVSERRYLKKIPSRLGGIKIFGVYYTEFIEVCTFSSKHQIFSPHSHKQIDIVLKKLA